MVKELATLRVLKDKIELLMVLESVVKVDDEWVPIDTLQDVALRLGLLDQFLMYCNGGFLKSLLSKEATGAELSDQKYSAVTALPKALHWLEVIGAHLAHHVVAQHGRGFRLRISAEVLVQVDFVAFHLGAVAVTGTV